MQFLRDILTWFFGYKYQLVVYQADNDGAFIVGNVFIKTKRLAQLDLDYVKNYVSEANNWDDKKIIILNII